MEANKRYSGIYIEPKGKNVDTRNVVVEVRDESMTEEEKKAITEKYTAMCQKKGIKEKINVIFVSEDQAQLFKDFLDKVVAKFPNFVNYAGENAHKKVEIHNPDKINQEEVKQFESQGTVDKQDTTLEEISIGNLDDPEPKIETL